MHLELAVPALFAEREIPRLPALELLLARGRVSRAEPLSIEKWLCCAFDLELQTVPAGALTVVADGGEPGTDFWLRADPVHLRVERDGLALVPSAGFTVAREEAAALAEALNRRFGDEFTLYPLHPARWCLRSRDEIALEAPPPLEIAGRNVDAHLPARRWHPLLNEIQMVLHEHPVNAAREVPINSLWLWGAGRIPAAARGPWQSTSASEPIALGLARLAGMRQRALPPGAAEWLDRAPENGRHLIVLDQLRTADALGRLDAAWFAPLLDALRRGRIEMITVHAPEAGASYETMRGDLRRFWRRARPIASPA